MTSAAVQSREEQIEEWITFDSLSTLLHNLAMGSPGADPAPLGTFIGELDLEKVGHRIDGGLFAELWPGDEEPSDEVHVRLCKQLSAMFLAIAGSAPYLRQCAKHFALLADAGEAKIRAEAAGKADA